MSKQFAVAMSLITIVVGGALAITQFPQRDISIPAVNVILPDGPCEEPLKYSIGDLDDRFDISRSAFEQAIADAAAVWESQTTRDLFQYDPAANFEVRLAFDERQRRTIQQEQIQSQLDELEKNHQQQATRYENIKDVYERELESYKENQAAYEEALDRYNSDVQYWNKRGGAPEDEYEQLQEDKERLDRMRSELEQQKQQVNALVQQLNSIADSTNELTEAYEETAQTYQQRFGSVRRFNQGEYHGDDITIYQFTDRQDLRLVLVHELGHALGIGHVQDSSAVMHAVMQDQMIEDITLTESDITALQEVCGLSEHQVE